MPVPNRARRGRRGQEVSNQEARDVSADWFAQNRPGKQMQRWGGGGGGGASASGGGGFSLDLPTGGGDYSSSAQRDIQAAYQPQLDLLSQQGAQAETDAAQYQGRIENLYAGLQGAIAPLGPAYTGQVAGIQDDYSAALAELAGQLPNVPASASTTGLAREIACSKR